MGTILSSEVSRKYGEPGLPDDTITLNFPGSAGQSFGGVLAQAGDLRDSRATPTTTAARDSVGAASSIVRVPPKLDASRPARTSSPERRALRGDQRRGLLPRAGAGERFCVRNSGAHAVVEGVGDHGCEYMTGGNVAVVLGPTGRNFAAGMSGGIAYVLDEEGQLLRSR